MLNTTSSFALQAAPIAPVEPPPDIAPAAADPPPAARVPFNRDALLQSLAPRGVGWHKAILSRSRIAALVKEEAALKLKRKSALAEAELGCPP